MYLIHVRLVARRPDAVLPDDAAALVMEHAEPQDRLEHVSAHPDAHPDPTLGLFLVSESLATAERTAAAVCRRALRGSAELAGFALGGSEVGVPFVVVDAIPADTPPE